MPSTLGWIAHDSRERESMTRVLALFREKESRDELGLAGIRDAISNELFPGTGTIQTRLRYMLFVPWIYQRLERNGVPSDQVARRARKEECALITPLLDEQEAGVLGRLARNELKRLPSAVYWAGLQSWGIMLYASAQTDYHREFSRIQALRARLRRRDDRDVDEIVARTWHEGIPEPPDGFPERVSFTLRRCEAQFLRDRICERHPDSLLAWLVNDPEPVTDAEYVWMHPRRGAFLPAHRELVHHAHVFAVVMQGAALLYNLELARLRRDDKLVGAYDEELALWLEELSSAAVREHVLDWNLTRFWALVCDKGSTITDGTRAFVTAWTSLVRAGTSDAIDGENARRLVRTREMLLKKAQSRFQSKRALDQWSGAAGLRLMSFRWSNVQRFLEDFSAGFADTEEG